MKKVCILGLGYIGLPTAIVAAQQGLDVIGFDIDKQRVDRINQSDPVIQEPEIFDKLQQVLSTKKFYATNTIEPADYFLIAVPTPFNNDKTADLSYVWHAVDLITQVITQGNVVILESTVPVGTTQKLSERIEEKTGFKAGEDFFVAHCPERVLPGNIFRELTYNARIIGGINQESMQRAKILYKYFVKGPLYLTNAATAEMIKLVENSFRDVNIAFAHQVAAMAYQLHLNPFEIIELANKHPRVNILQPSAGVGGHCIAVDPWFLIETFPEQTVLLKAARIINDEKPQQVVASIYEHVKKWQQQHAGVCKVSLLGLAYKPDIDDIRESPALEIAEQLLKNNAIDLLLCEPHVDEKIIISKLNKQTVPFAYAVEQADIIVCLVNHRLFKTLNTYEINDKIVIDVCGLLYEQHKHQEEQEHVFWPASNAYYHMPTINQD